MKIDLHCHTRKTKQGDAKTRNVEKTLFSQKVLESDVKIIAITNHNLFDYEQFLEFQAAVDEYCKLWPGIEIDISCSKDGEKNKRGHLIVVANPVNAAKFSKATKGLIGDIKPDDFLIDIKSVFNSLNDCDCIYIPHYHKKPGFSDEDVAELRDLLSDKTRLFTETSDYRSLGVFSNFDYSMMIGSDVQDWNTYENSTFADIRLPIQTFEQFCLLAKKDSQVINTLLNEKKKKEISVSPCDGVSFKIPFFNDVNIIFGQKGTGKSEIISSLKRYCIDNDISHSDYYGSDKDEDFSKLLKVEKSLVDPIKMGLKSLKEEFSEIYNWSEELPTSILRYISWYETKDNNKNKQKMKITESVHLETISKDRKLDSDYKSVSEFVESPFLKVKLENYLSKEEVEAFESLIDKLLISISEKKTNKWIDEKSIKLTNWSIDKIKSIADKCSDTISKPSSTGFTEFALKRFRIVELISEIETALSEKDHIEKEYLGNIEEKGDIYIQTRYRMIKKDSKTDEFVHGIQSLKRCRNTFTKISKDVFSGSLSSDIEEFRELYDDGIKDISYFIGVVKETAFVDGHLYKPSNGERGILLMQKALGDDSDIYLLDEPELGMGNSYITSTILPRLKDLAKQRKMVVVATHNANIAVGTLPYQSILRTHENGEYKTYYGNPFCDELVNIDDNNDSKNWTIESMHTLEGGRDAFYDRKDIYESGRKNN